MRRRYQIVAISLLAMFTMVVFSCQSKDIVLVKKDMEFVGQFNKAFSYEIAGLGPIIREIRFSEADILELAREEVPELADLGEIHVVDVGLNVRPDANNEAEYIDFQITDDSTSTLDILSIQQLLISGDLNLDPSQLGIGDDYEEMITHLNNLLQGGNLDDYVLNLLLDPEDTNALTAMNMEVIFAIKFSFSACVDVPAGTNAKDCQ